VGLALALLEGGLRLYSALRPNADVEFVRYARLMKKSAPGSATSFRHLPGAHARLMGVDVAIDRRGFRDEPKDAAVRIALLGDSITFGWGVPYGERFSEILEDEWSKDLGRSVDLINTGHGNYNAAQERAMLEEAFADETVDAVLQVWYVNDAEPTPPHRELPWYERFHTAVFVWAKADLLRRRLGARGTYVDYYLDLYRPDAPGLRAFEGALGGVGAWSRARGVPWVFVVLPEFHSFAPGPFDEVYRRVGDLAPSSWTRRRRSAASTPRRSAWPIMTSIPTRRGTRSSRRRFTRGSTCGRCSPPGRGRAMPRGPRPSGGRAARKIEARREPVAGESTSRPSCARRGRGHRARPGRRDRAAGLLRIAAAAVPVPPPLSGEGRT
jgi:hypothetical protein